MKIVYWIATVLLCLILLFSAGIYIFNHAFAITAFRSLNYPTYLIYPLAAAKILGVLALLTGKSPTLKEWAYAGIFFDLVLAVAAHLNANDGGYLLALIALVLWTISYTLQRKEIARSDAL